MTFTLMVLLNVVLDIAILGALAFVMSRPARLRRHGEAVPATATPRRRTSRDRERTQPAVSTAYPSA
jgi:hypothetical protein